MSVRPGVVEGTHVQRLVAKVENTLSFSRIHVEHTRERRFILNSSSWEFAHFMLTFIVQNRRTSRRFREFNREILHIKF